MRTENPEIRQYLKEVKDSLNCPGSVRRAFLRKLKEDVVLFAAQQPNVLREDLCARFGTPREIAAGFFDRQETGLLLKKARMRVLAWKIIGILACAALLLGIIYLFHIIDITSGYYEVSDPY